MDMEIVKIVNVIVQRVGPVNVVMNHYYHHLINVENVQ